MELSHPSINEALEQGGIIYQLPKEFLRDFNTQFLQTIPAEKAAQEMAEADISRNLRAEGAHKVDGLGQMMGKVPVREYFRWHQQMPGCWQDDNFVREFFRDNSHLRAEGYVGHKKGPVGKRGRWAS